MKKSAKKLPRQRRQEKERALYVRLPHVIRDHKDVAKLFTGDFKVKLPRQSSRHCYVVFADNEEKIKNLKATKNTRIDGKRVTIAPAIIKLEKVTKLRQKKIVIPPVKEETKVTKTLFVSNIKCDTKPDDVKAAMPGCISVKMLSSYSKKSKAAMVKMESSQVAAEYLLKIRDRPIVKGRKLRLNPDTRTRKRSKPLKFYDDGKVIYPEFEQKRTFKSSNDALDYISLENET